MPTKNLVITEQQSQWVEALVQNGRYQNASEVMREGLRLLEQRERDFEIRQTALTAALKAGMNDVDGGRLESFDTAASAAAYLRERSRRAVESNQATKAGK